jgi:adenylosuccinate lyase
VSSTLGINAAAKAAKIERRANRMRNYREAVQAVEQYTQIAGSLEAGAAAADQLGSSTVMGNLGAARNDTLATLNYVNRQSKMGQRADSLAQTAATYGQIADNANGLTRVGEGIYDWISNWGRYSDNALNAGPPDISGDYGNG